MEISSLPSIRQRKRMSWFLNTIKKRNIQGSLSSRCRSPVQPLFKGGRLLPADIHFRLQGRPEGQGQLLILMRLYTLYRIDMNDVLAVGTVEDGRVQQFFHFFQSSIIQYEFISVKADEVVQGIFYEAGDIGGLYRYPLMSLLDNKLLFVHGRLAGHFQDLHQFAQGSRTGGISSCIEERPVDGPCEILIGHRFQQVTNAVDLECTDGIFIVGGDENNGAAQFKFIEEAKAEPIGQLDIHEKKVRLAVLHEPAPGCLQAGQSLHNFNLFRQLVDPFFQVTRQQQFVFDNNSLHISGIFMV